MRKLMSIVGVILLTAMPAAAQDVTGEISAIKEEIGKLQDRLKRLASPCSGWPCRPSR